MSNTKRPKKVISTVFAGLILLSAAMCSGQDHSLDVYGRAEKGIQIPHRLSRGSTQSDDLAVRRIERYLTSTNTGSWTNMHGKGNISYQSQNSGPYAAEIWIANAEESRLDITTAEGISSTRIRGSVGFVITADGKRHHIPEDTAYLGLLQFPQANRSRPNVEKQSVLDGGIVSVDGKTMHMVSLEIERPSLSPYDRGKNHVAVIQYYFDAENGLLSKSVSLIKTEETGAQEFLRVITYRDFRRISGSLVPFQYEESIDGKTEWILQLAEVELGANLPHSLFQSSWGGQ